MKRPENIKTLEDLYNSEYFQSSYQFGCSNDGWIEDSERMERITEAAEYGGDGSTHGEHIQDWRDCLESLDLPDNIRESITREIDECEQWHVDNGSIDEQIG